MALYGTAARVSQTARRARWRNHLDTWSASNESQAAFCRKRGLDPNSFSAWKRKLNWRPPVDGLARPASASKESVFVPLKVLQSASPLSNAGSAPLFEIVLRNGRVLRAGLNADAGCLARLAAALEA